MIDNLRLYCEACGTDFDVALTLDEQELLVETNKSAFRAALLKAKGEGNLLTFLVNYLGQEGALAACFGMVGNSCSHSSAPYYHSLSEECSMVPGTKNIYELWPELAEAQENRFAIALNNAKENRLCNPHYTWSRGQPQSHYSSVEPESGTELTPEISEAISQLAEKIKFAKGARVEALK